MICSDICINTTSDISKLLYVVSRAVGEWNLRQFCNITSGIYAKYHVQIMLLFVYTTTRKRFVIFTCRYFKLSWNTTALSQSNCRNFSCSSIIDIMPGVDQNEEEAILRTCTVSDSKALCAALQMKCQCLNLFISHLFIFFNSLIMAPKLREIISVFRCFNFLIIFPKITQFSQLHAK